MSKVATGVPAPVIDQPEVSVPTHIYNNRPTHLGSTPESVRGAADYASAEEPVLLAGLKDLGKKAAGGAAGVLGGEAGKKAVDNLIKKDEKKETAPEAAAAQLYLDGDRPNQAVDEARARIDNLKAQSTLSPEDQTRLAELDKALGKLEQKRDFDDDKKVKLSSEHEAKLISGLQWLRDMSPDFSLEKGLKLDLGKDQQKALLKETGAALIDSESDQAEALLAKLKPLNDKLNPPKGEKERELDSAEQLRLLDIHLQTKALAAPAAAPQQSDQRGSGSSSGGVALG